MKDWSLKSKNYGQKKTRYNLKALNQLLTDDATPEELGDQMDEIMSDLVTCAGRDDDYPGHELEWKYFILRTLRNIFWEMAKAK